MCSVYTLYISPFVSTNNSNMDLEQHDENTIFWVNYFSNQLKCMHAFLPLNQDKNVNSVCLSLRECVCSKNIKQKQYTFGPNFRGGLLSSKILIRDT